MSKIEIKDLYLVFGKEKTQALRQLKAGKSKADILQSTACTIAVQDANLAIKEGEIFVVMGLSGSGKSSLLRCINKLVKPTKGQVLIDGVDVLKATEKQLLEIRRKELAMVFQHFGLLPHRTVLSNISFGLELQGVEKEDRHDKAMKSMELVGLEGYEDMMVSELSGGMQQRVGLARALANDPEVLLMDEAFSALDPLIRVQMQDELLAIQQKMKKTIVFITHDLNEAIRIGDRIAIMKDGEIVQVGTPEEILTHPANDYVDSFVESVDRGKIVSASSIMIEKPVVVRHPREGSAVTLRKMRSKNLSTLPVVNQDKELLGQVRIRDIAVLRRKNISSIETAIRPDNLTVEADAILEDILPLLTKTNSPICVTDKDNKLLGLIPLNWLVVEMTGKEEEEIEEIIQSSQI